MRAITYVSFFCAVLTCQPVWCQSVIEYYDQHNTIVDATKSKFFIIGKKNGRGYYYDSVKTFYTSTRTIKALEVRDQFGNRIGNYRSFYPNGSARLSGRYERKNFKIFNSSMDSTDFTILEFFDSTGHRQVYSGNGKINGRLDDVREAGVVFNGLRDSVWTSWYDNGKVMSHESWLEGELVDGVSYDPDGKEYYYKQRLTMPEPEGGMTSFFEQISRRMNYPEKAERRGIEGKIIVEFIVEKNGAINSARALDHLGFGCDEEAVRVLLSSPAWKPAMEKGQPIRHRATIPFLFKLK